MCYIMTGADNWSKLSQLVSLYCDTQYFLSNFNRKEWLTAANILGAILGLNSLLFYFNCKILEFCYVSGSMFDGSIPDPEYAWHHSLWYSWMCGGGGSLLYQHYTRRGGRCSLPGGGHCLPLLLGHHSVRLQVPRGQWPASQLYLQSCHSFQRYASILSQVAISYRVSQ